MDRNTLRDTFFDTAARTSQDRIAVLGASVADFHGVVPLLDGFPTAAMLLCENRQILAMNNRAAKLFSAGEKTAIGKRFGEAVSCVHSSEMPAGCGTSRACRECGAAKAIKFTRDEQRADVSECRITVDVEGLQRSLDLRVFTTPVDLGARLTLLAVDDIADEKRRETLERIFFHDVGNTATAVSGVAGLLPDVSDPEKLKDLVSALTRSTTQLIDEIAAQRDLMAAESGELTVALSSASVNKIVGNVESVYAASPFTDGKKLVVNRATEDVMVETDAVQASRCLGNLVKNALEAADRGDTVRVWVEDAGSAAFVRVANPQVIPESTRLQIFQRSFSTKAARGRGLGSYSVKLIAEQYLKAAVSFDSNEATGTVFSLRLPKPAAYAHEEAGDFRSLLLSASLVTRDELRLAAEHAEREGVPLVDALVAVSAVAEIDAYRTLARSCRLQLVVLDEIPAGSFPSRMVPEKVARKHQIVPLRVDDRVLTYAVARPFDDETDRDVAFVSGRRTHRVLAPPSQIVHALDRCYPKRSDLDELLERVRRDAPAHAREWTVEQTGSPVIDLCNRLMTRALEVRASDIHMEPSQKAFDIRYRVGGILEQAFELPREVAPAVTNRFKVMASVDIFVRNKPQDGAFRTVLDNRNIDVRLSTLPTIHGEKVVMRIIDAQLEMSTLDRLGYNQENLERLRRALARPDGLVLVSGPTGSGKTTVLYAALNHLRTGRTNIITVEDPVERRIEGVNQIAVNNKGGATFAAVLRSVLRQDPNVIMVGEIRDGEVAGIVGQAAYTGHLVLSTVHASDAASAVTRLLNLGLEPYKIAESLSAIVAQRLIRKLCPECKRTLEPEEARRLGESCGLPAVPSDVGPGCDRCKKSGYVERVPVAEILVASETVQAAIAEGASGVQLRAAMRSAGCRSMRENALAMVAQGLTSLEEVNRVLVDDLAATPHVAAPEKQTVLVADDDRMVRMLVRILLEHEGFEVSEAENGRLALDMMRKSPPSVAIVDLAMPEVDGYEMIRTMRKEPDLCAVPIVTLTASIDATTQQRVLALGADDYLVKPFEREALVARVRAVLRRAESQQAK